MMRNISKREQVLFAVLLLIIFGAAYFVFFAQPTMNRRAAAEAQVLAIQDETMIETVRLKNMNTMQARIDEIDGAATSDTKIPLYDNLEQVMKQLDAILAGAQGYSLSFSAITPQGTLVYRPIDVKFSVANYAAARNIVDQINASQYKCVIDTVGISMPENAGGNVAENGVEVSMSIIFIETTAKE